MILVTGGTGLVGSHLLAELVKQNQAIRAIYRSEEKLKLAKNVFSYYFEEFDDKFSKIEWVKADINDVPSLELAFKNINYVYHCAAIVSFNEKDYQSMRKTNIEGTANMINLSIANNIKKFCYVSSIATIEKNTKKESLITEENEWNKESNNYGYAITKYGAEMEVWRGSQEGLRVVVVNPGVILGSGFWYSGPGELFTKMYNGFKFYTEGITGFVGVKDVVKTMIQLMESDIKNERFILISENKSFKNLFFKIADTFNKNRPSIKVGKTLSNIAWRIEKVKSLISGKPPLITKHSASASLSTYQYDSGKIKKYLNYKFESLDKTIQDACKNFEQDLIKNS
jgi:nucleoside-diphosphate-sugar epimerase